MSVVFTGSNYGIFHKIRKWSVSVTISFLVFDFALSGYILSFSCSLHPFCQSPFLTTNSSQTLDSYYSRQSFGSIILNTWTWFFFMSSLFILHIHIFRTIFLPSSFPNIFYELICFSTIRLEIVFTLIFATWCIAEIRLKFISRSKSQTRYESFLTICRQWEYIILNLNMCSTKTLLSNSKHSKRFFQSKGFTHLESYLV